MIFGYPAGFQLDRFCYMWIIKCCVFVVTFKVAERLLCSTVVLYVCRINRWCSMMFCSEYYSVIAVSFPVDKLTLITKP